MYYCLYYWLFILCILLNLRYFLGYHVMVNKVVYIQANTAKPVTASGPLQWQAAAS